jgi:hypothetical protein
VDPFDAFSLAGDGDRLVDRFLGVRSSLQPHHAIGIGIDVYIPQARDVLRSKLRLYLGRDRRILDERLGCASRRSEGLTEGTLKLQPQE